MHPAPPTRETRVYAIDCKMVRRHFSSTCPTQLNIVFDRRQRGTNLGLRHRPRVRHRRMTTSSNHPNPSSNTLQSNASPPFWTHAHHPPSRWSGIADVSLAEVQTQLLTTLAPKGDIHPHRSLPRIGSQSPLQRHRTHVPPPSWSTTRTRTRMGRQEMVSPQDPDVRRGRTRPRRRRARLSCVSIGLPVHDTPVQLNSLAGSRTSNLFASHFDVRISFWDIACTNRWVGLVVERAGI